MLYIRILKGQGTKQELNRIYFPILFCIVVLWAIARLLYPLDGGYSINDNRISRQGNVLLNPLGAWFFILGTAFAAIMLIPYVVYMYHRFKPTLLLLDRLMLFSGLVGCIGLFMVAIFPEYLTDQIDAIHSTGADMAFTGLGVTVLFSIIILFRRVRQHQPWPTLGQVLNLFLMILFFGLIMVFTDGSVNQWTGFFMVFVWCTGIYYLLPESNN
jgi:hypothetical protein